MQDFFSALALVLVIEGVLDAAFPTQMRNMVQRMSEFPDSILRGSGLLIAGLGVIAVWLIRKFF